ncbi:MAG: hypothetical protein RDU25_05815 [Patescibacteria group bacterium]|nr:hypothetical protein [Patescibacteria group bacterium]
MPSKLDRFILWTPRILSILFLLFLATFSLDVFEEGLDFWGTLLGLFMHNIPVFVLAIVLTIAWKRKLIGAIFYTLAGFAYIGLLTANAVRGNFEFYMISWSIIIAGPAFVIAVLFYAGWRKKLT